MTVPTTIPTTIPTTPRPTQPALLRSSTTPVPPPAGVDAMLAAATREIVVARTLAPGPPLATFRRADYENLRRGVRYRVLVPDCARTRPGVATRLRELALAGAEVRTLPSVPVDAMVIDGALAVLPDEQRNASRGVALFRLPSVVRTTLELFERVWPVAAPLATPDRPQPKELSDRDREVLTLLFAGWTDESVAARLGISVRTVRRMVAAVMDRLGARSRFQAGAKAADRGWLVERAS